MYLRLRVVKLRDGRFAVQISADNLSWKVAAIKNEPFAALDFAKALDKELNDHIRVVEPTHVLWRSPEPSKTIYAKE